MTDTNKNSVTNNPIPDERTAKAFANSWNSLPDGSIYSWDQFVDWLRPVSKQFIAGRTVLEMGCGNGSLMEYMLRWEPKHIHGIDLGDSVLSARRNLERTGSVDWSLEKVDLNAFRGGGFDFVYCIGVLHHLQDPEVGFKSVVANVKSGGRFHCWVYAEEGNGLVIALVEPIRWAASKIPWWINKHLISTPLAALFYFYVKTMMKIRPNKWIKKLPLYLYCGWISGRSFQFFRHVVFDQLVTPKTCYINRQAIDTWLSLDCIDSESVYVELRNGNSWKFGGKKI